MGATAKDDAAALKTLRHQLFDFLLEELTAHAADRPDSDVSKALKAELDQRLGQIIEQRLLDQAQPLADQVTDTVMRSVEARLSGPPRAGGPATDSPVWKGPQVEGEGPQRGRPAVVQWLVRNRNVVAISVAVLLIAIAAIGGWLAGRATAAAPSTGVVELGEGSLQASPTPAGPVIYGEAPALGGGTENGAASASQPGLQSGRAGAAEGQ